ncbi:YraN family protein [Aurantibacillus circumpalustris]|uniref:YraN family protein n=1 Tax=Aurantibacillus circumpalustris TaxID=3036359 RepID=UPI00295B9388|nr:YraN family protein [Aurantibacillus circumpalustris]
MNNNSQKQGQEGEIIARKYLISKGYELLELNWRFRKYEIDIIAKKDETIVFVEVKTRKSNTFGEPEVFVTKQKQNFLIAAANQYLIENNIDLESRFDIISVLQFNNNHTVKHLEAAFYPLLK